MPGWRRGRSRGARRRWPGGTCRRQLRAAGAAGTLERLRAKVFLALLTSQPLYTLLPGHDNGPDDNTDGGPDGNTDGNSGNLGRPADGGDQDGNTDGGGPGGNAGGGPGGNAGGGPDDDDG